MAYPPKSAYPQPNGGGPHLQRRSSSNAPLLVLLLFVIISGCVGAWLYNENVVSSTPAELRWVDQAQSEPGVEDPCASTGKELPVLRIGDTLPHPLSAVACNARRETIQKKIRWKTDAQNSVMKVAQTGTVTCASSGEGNVTGTLRVDKQTTLEIAVQVRCTLLKAIRLTSPSTMHMGDGPVPFHAEALDDRGNVVEDAEVNISISDPEVIEIVDGQIVPHKAGVAQIHASIAGFNFVDDITVTVLQKIRIVVVVSDTNKQGAVWDIGFPQNEPDMYVKMGSKLLTPSHMSDCSDEASCQCKDDHSCTFYYETDQPEGSFTFEVFDDDTPLRPERIGEVQCGVSQTCGDEFLKVSVQLVK